MFLVQKMGFGWEQVHEIAEQIEHIKSDLFFDKIDELLNHPKVDPHGSPIPDRNGNIVELNYLTLGESREGQTVILKAITDSPKDFLRYLNQKQIALETEIEILEKESFDRSMKVHYHDRTEVLSALVADRLLVEKK